jgi:hypothetical protein
VRDEILCGVDQYLKEYPYLTENADERNERPLETSHSPMLSYIVPVYANPGRFRAHRAIVLQERRR